MRSKALLVGALAMAMATGCSHEIPGKAAPPTIDLVAVVTDQSKSLTCDPAVRARRAMAAIERERLIAAPDPLEVLVLGTGDSPGYEPRCLVPWTEVATRVPQPFEDPDAPARELAGTLSRLEATCASNGSDLGSSPILLALVRAASSLQSRRQLLESEGMHVRRVVLAIQADMRENVDADMAARIRCASTRKKALGAPPVVLDSHGIEMTVCGISDTDGRGADERLTPEALIVAWHDVLGDGAPSSWDASCATELVAARASVPTEDQP